MKKEKITNKNGYSVNAVKSFVGMEGYGFNANLLKNGKKVAFVIDDANGGEYMYQFLTDESAKEFFDFMKTLPKWECCGKMVDYLADSFVAELVDEFEIAKKMRSACKKAICFRFKDDDENTYRSIKGNATSPEWFAKASAHVLNKYPEAIILNPLYQ